MPHNCYSGKISQGRETAYLEVINSSHRDHRDYIYKTRTPEGRNHRTQRGKGKEEEKTNSEGGKEKTQQDPA